MVDASAWVALVLGQPVPALTAALVDRTVTLISPALCDVEVASALRKAILDGRLAVRRAREAATDYLDLPIHRHGHEALLHPILELRDNLTAYDATYASLASALDCELYTADRPLARTVTHDLGLPVNVVTAPPPPS